VNREISIRLTLTPAALRAWLTGILLVFCAAELCSENVTLTTYYPAPSGVYSRMITTDNTFLATSGVANVGIGTTNPVAKLSIVADTSNGGNEDARHGLTIKSGRANNQTLMIGYDGTSDVAYINAAKSGSYQPVVLQSRGGNVGIGTANPQHSLHVAGGVYARGGPLGAGGVNNNGYAFYGTGDNDSGMTSSADGQLEFYSNSAEVARIAPPDGNVGIGTTAPQAKLDVKGTFRVQTSQAPQADYVLTALDNQGNVGWKPAAAAQIVPLMKDVPNANPIALWCPSGKKVIWAEGYVNDNHTPCSGLRAVFQIPTSGGVVLGLSGNYTNQRGYCAAPQVISDCIGQNYCVYGGIENCGWGGNPGDTCLFMLCM